MTHPPKDILSLAKHVLQYTYAPYSNFSVSACVWAADDSLYAGVNVENGSYGLCRCGETNAITQMVSKGHRTIKEALVLVPGSTPNSPRDSCRQQLFEIFDKEMAIHLCTTEANYIKTSLTELLPRAFGPSSLEKS